MIQERLGCPKIREHIQTIGCYNCDSGTIVIFEARSTCDEGVAEIYILDHPVAMSIQLTD